MSCHEVEEVDYGGSTGSNGLCDENKGSRAVAKRVEDFTVHDHWKEAWKREGGRVCRQAIVSLSLLTQTQSFRLLPREGQTSRIHFQQRGLRSL